MNAVIIDPQKLIGAKVNIKSLTIHNGMSWSKDDQTEECTVEDIGFKISLDGKCFTIVTLKEHPTRRFTLGDLIVISLPKDESEQ